MNYMKHFFSLITLMSALYVGHGQKVTGKLKFEQGQQVDIKTEVKTTISQEAMGQVIDFNVDGIAHHFYKVTNATDDNSTLHHETSRIQFNFEGMGQKRPFDSDKEKDQKSSEGKVIKELLKKTFDIIIDPAGKVLMVQPEKSAPVEMEGAMKLISSMMKDVVEVVEAPAKGTNGFFKILPDYETGKGDTWNENFENASGKFENTYTLKEITDSTINIELAGTSVTTTKVEMMPGMEITTFLKNKTTGMIIIDKLTGIVRQKIVNTESTGTTQGMGGETPINSKTSITITVSPVK